MSFEIGVEYSRLRLIFTEELKDLPYGMIWQEFCERHDALCGRALTGSLETYQASVSGRG